MLGIVPAMSLWCAELISRLAFGLATEKVLSSTIALCHTDPY